MAQKASKIDREKLAPVILDLQSKGVTTSAAIAQKLEELGYKISQPSVSRWLKAHNDVTRDTTRKLVEDHVKATVPADLEALEEMEAACLSWAKEDESAMAERVAGKKIAESVLPWQKLILNATPDKLGETVFEIMRECLRLIALDTTLQKRRLAAMKQAASIIDLKLRYSGIIDASASGNVFLVDGRNDRLERDSKSGRLLVFKGGVDKDAERPGI